MSNRTFCLIFDGKKGSLIKGTSPSSAAKKIYKKLSAETGKSNFKFELQETTKGSKKKMYGPYKGYLDNYKIKVKMVGGRDSGNSGTHPPLFTVMRGGAGVFFKDRIKNYTVEKIDRDFFMNELTFWLPHDHFFYTIHNGNLYGNQIPVRVRSIKKINDDNTDGENIENEFIIGKIGIVLVSSEDKTNPNDVKILTATLRLPNQDGKNNMFDIRIDNRDRTIEHRKSMGLNRLTFIN